MNSQMFVKKQKSDSEQQVYTLEEEQKLIKQAWLDYENKPEVTTPLAVILLFYLVAKGYSIYWKGNMFAEE